MTDDAMHTSFAHDRLHARLAQRPPPALSESETIEMARRSTWPRVGFALLMGALSAPFLDWRAIAVWVAFALAWELVVRPFLEDRVVLTAAPQGRPDLRLAAIHAIGSAAYCVLPVLLWQTQQALAMVVATVWICASANHAFVYFAGRRSLLIACLAPLAACILLAPVAAQQHLSAPSIIGAMALVAFVAGTGIWGFDRRALMRTFSARIQAEGGEQARARFLSTMSHELRTPLNAVIGYAELIEEESAAASGDARHIRLAAQRLLNLINTVLEISRLDAEPIRIAAEPCDVPSLLAEIRTRAVPLASANRNAFFALNAPDAVELRTNPDRLQQCLSQLVSNACKFTSDGEVRLNVSRNNEDFFFVVSDTGIGIPEAQLETIFEPFAQVDSSDTRRHEGAGLGLALARQIARSLGGDITCRSQLGRGAIFTLRLPADGAR